MIGRLRGIILEKQPPLVLLETAGVGYEVHMPMTCFYELPGKLSDITYGLMVCGIWSPVYMTERDGVQTLAVF